ncbi:MAG: primosomal protein N' [Bacilli bacterium]|nr:primosomal protein N' [Bacilli bacterium]
MKLVELYIEYSASNLDRPFTYFYNGDKPLDVGFRVLVNFNAKEIVGYVTNIKEVNNSKEEIEESLGFNISEIKDVLDTRPLLNEDLLDLANEISDYYLASKISVLQAMLPPSLSPRKSSLKAPKIAYNTYLVMNDDSEEDLTPKQIEILRLIKQEEKVLKSEIKSPSIIKKLLLLNKIKEIKEEKRRLELPNYDLEINKTLTPDQQKVIDEFNNSNDEVYLLEGVTGSGKTEVYLSLSEEVIKQGKQVLMLVPEISLTPMMNEYFIKRFNHTVAILHSELTPAEKYDEYRKIASGDIKVVVGARSAIFAPLNNIGLIILDEEHTESYKQDTPPFYHAKEVALMRGKKHHAKVLLGSATPSLESRARAQKGHYHLLMLTKRINQQPLPLTTVVNLLDYKNIDRESYIFSKQLRNSIRRVLDKKEQAILLLNRRGFSSHVSCRSCGYTFKCPNCGIALTYHRIDNMMKCHHCDYVLPYPEVCPECGSKYLSRIGFGTEKVEEEVKRLFPDARVLRLDSDSAKVRTRVAKTVEAFRNHEADILIGTQMIAKGHDFPLVTLVGVVLADIGLNMPNYRSSERAFQLITQAVGRSGRKDKIGEAFIQTYMPTHYAITYAAQQNYEGFYRTEMDNRKKTFFPPYCYLASLTISGKNEERVIQEAINLSKILNEKFMDKGVVLGPVSPYVPFLKGSHIRVILIKYKDKCYTKEVLQQINVDYLYKSNVKILCDMDPYNF